MEVMEVEDRDFLQKRAEQEEQIGFIRKVLGIVAVQMALTFAMSATASAFTSVGTFVMNPFVQFLCLFVLIISLCVLVCSEKTRRTVPGNYLWLFALTLAEATSIASMAAELEIFSVLTAIMATCLVTACLFFAALYTSTSVNIGRLVRNMVIGVVAACLLNIALLLWMLVTWNFRDSNLVIVSSMLSVVIVGFYIMMVLLMIILPGAMDKDDYILAALRLYLELVRLFFYLLVILGKKK